jgi:uncharacterized protein (TIGR01777 family)
LRILISGAGGTIGRALAPALTADGHTVTRLVRIRPRDAREFRWDPAVGIMDPAAITSCDAVIHLAGAGIAAGRWTAARKAEIMESRRVGTRLIAAAIARAVPPPRILLCASAVGYYGDRGDETLTEESGPGAGFLAEVVRVWEAEARVAVQAGVRVVHLRQGLVLARHGGALPRIAFPFRLGLGGPIGDGRHWLSWIDLEDLIRMVQHVLARDDTSGPINAVSPRPVTHADFSRALARVLGRPALVRVPGWLLRAVLGEMGRELLLFSQRVVPARLVAGGFTFGHPGIEEALRHAFEVATPS